jgi:hypothetical protein
VALKAYIIFLAVMLIALVGAFGLFEPLGWSEGGF